jgi:hypothetical protein
MKLAEPEGKDKNLYFADARIPFFLRLKCRNVLRSSFAMKKEIGSNVFML